MNREAETDLDFPWSIPTTWRWTKMAEVSTVIAGGTPSTTESANFEGGTIPWITPADLSGFSNKIILQGGRSITQRGLDGSGAQLIPKGSVLFSSRAPIGYVAIAGCQLTTNQGFKSFALGPALTSDYVYYYLQRAKELAVKMASGTTFLEISKKKAEVLPIPIAPLPEQRRIVEAIESNFARLEAGVVALDRTARTLEAYWRSVLGAAFSGRITDAEASGLAHEESGGGGVPRGWTLTTVGELKQFSMYGPRFSSDEYSDDGTAIVRTTDMREDASIDFSESPRIHLTAEDLERYRLQRGDLLLTRTGSLGTLAVYNGETDAIAGAFLIQYRLKHPMTTVRYVAYWLRSPTGRARLLSHATGSGRPNLSSPGIDSVPVPLPPMEEQSRILETLDKHYSWFLAVRDAIRESRSRATRVREGVLRSAFSGRLVPQDPNDEPASVLLERIRKERSSVSQSMTRKRKTPRAT